METNRLMQSELGERESDWCCHRHGVIDPRTTEEYCPACGYVLRQPEMVPAGHVEPGSVPMRLHYDGFSLHLSRVDAMERERALPEDPRSEREILAAIEKLTEANTLGRAVLSEDGARRVLELREQARESGIISGQPFPVQVGACAYALVRRGMSSGRVRLDGAKPLRWIAHALGIPQTRVKRLALDLIRGP